MTTVALVSSIAFSLTNFRGPLIELLVARGVMVLALAPDHDDRTRADLRALGAEPVDFSLDRTGMNPPRDLADAVRLALLLRRLRPDAVLCYFAKPVIYGTIAAFLAGVPRRIAMVEGLGYVFIDGAAPLGWRRRLLRRATRLLYRTALGRAHRVVFLNREDREEFVSGRLVDQAKTVNIGGIGVDLTGPLPGPPPTDPMRFLLVARLLREKGITEFVEAARLVKADHPDTQFTIVGGFDPNPGGYAPAEVRQWADDGVIDWPGHVDDVPARMAASSAVVLPSYREGVPRALQEAAALGRPLIAADSVGCRDTVEHEVNGLLVPVRDVSALAQAMRWMIAHPERLAEMGAAGRALAERKFDIRRSSAVISGLLVDSLQ